MGNNITSHRIRSIDLRLPLTFNFQAWIQTQPDQDENGYRNDGKHHALADHDQISVNLAEGLWCLPRSYAYLSGRIEGESLVATSIECRDDGSGTIYCDILLPLFRQFKGNLSALIIWEGGNTVCDVTILDGVVHEKTID